MSDLTQPPHVPSCVSTGEGVTVPTATATPRTIEQVAQECAEKILPLFTRGSWSRQVKDTDPDQVALVITAAMREVVERELSSAQAALAEAKREATAQGEHAVAMTELAQSLERELAAPINEAALRARNGGSLPVGNGCEVAIRGTTAALQAAQAEVARLNRGLFTIRDSCENCTNSSDLREQAAQIIGRNEDKNPMVYHSEYYNCERFTDLEKKLTALRARVAIQDQQLDEMAPLVNRVAELEQDKARLDWLEAADGGLVCITIPCAELWMSLREAIDAAKGRK